MTIRIQHPLTPTLAFADHEGPGIFGPVRDRPRDSTRPQPEGQAPREHRGTVAMVIAVISFAISLETDTAGMTQLCRAITVFALAACLGSYQGRVSRSRISSFPSSNS